MLNCIHKNPWAPMAHDTHGILTVVDTLMSATIANGGPLQTIRVLLQWCGSVPFSNPSYSEVRNYRIKGILWHSPAVMTRMCCSHGCPSLGWPVTSLSAFMILVSSVTQELLKSMSFFITLPAIWAKLWYMDRSLSLIEKILFLQEPPFRLDLVYILLPNLLFKCLSSETISTLGRFLKTCVFL